MKKICLFLFITVALQAFAQNKDYIISMEGLGTLKLGMTQADLEKLLNQKIVLDNHLDTIIDSYLDTAKLKYKGINVQLEFNRSYYAPNVFHMRLIGIRASSPLCKTASGISIGTDQLKIITAYPNNGMVIQPGYYNYYETEKGKGKSTISIMDDSANQTKAGNTYIMRLFLLNKKVVSFELKAQLIDERPIVDE
ncbi:MAG: hypothetical protein SGI83_04905 [Bacteroidota bacterium]|nr:hypothetical protein [Bacteroidota bacterium]